MARALTLLWQTMDAGGMYGAEQLARFNGHFFRTVEALALEPKEVMLLIEASKFDWSRVEPSIFGTLLVRALDPEERHRLGAEYTPREYIQRLIEPTVVEPIREKWVAVQGVVLQLEGSGKKRDRESAVVALRDFHAWMRGLHFLDPACGSGNFLYVTMAAVKAIELEVFNELQRLAGGQGGLVLDEVHPRQFHGIEIKPWAREIAELTLWIGYHQFWRETHGGRTPPTPILEDTGTLECRDAVLAWDEIVHRPERDRPDPTPRIRHPVTGELVPDPNAKLPYYEYVGARAAEWPRADFIVGNPPYIGNKRMRGALGDGYVDALRTTYDEVPEGADFVMYWWYKSARAVGDASCDGAGLITTNSITQSLNRVLIERAAKRGVVVQWAVNDHPWVDELEGAAVRVAMTSIARRSSRGAVLVQVDEHARIVESIRVSELNSDLTSGANVARAAVEPLQSNAGLSYRGFTVVGSGFILTDAEAQQLLKHDENAEIIRAYVNGKDLAQRPRGYSILDFGLASESEAKRFAQLYDIVRNRVMAERQGNGRKAYRDYWWRFAEPRRALRGAREDLEQMIVSPYVSKHRFFLHTRSQIALDDTVVAIALHDSSGLGVLSSGIHIAWAESAGSRLGVGNDPRYNNPRCFDSFPFPDPPPDLRTRIAALAERLDTHRKDALARDERVTMTGMYNVVEKLRSGEALTPKERTIHEIAACGVLRDIHDELDALVAEGYGWPWPVAREGILERLVALHDERVAEEQRGIVRWLRPEYQVPRFGNGNAPVPEADGSAQQPLAPEETAFPSPRPAWPATAVEQLASIAALLTRSPLSCNEVVAALAGAKRDLVTRHLETLAIMGEINIDVQGRYSTAAKAS